MYDLGCCIRQSALGVILSGFEEVEGLSESSREGSVFRECEAIPYQVKCLQMEVTPIDNFVSLLDHSYV